MAKIKQPGGPDRFKPTAAFLVVAIHTSPLASFSADADFIVTRVIARVAVPFFFMVTGYFLLPQYIFGRSMDRRPLRHSLKKLFLLYLAAMLLYLPVNLYAGQFKELGIGAFLRMVLVDGTFYHLWYLPAAISGVAIVCFLCRRIPFKALIGISAILYLIGLFGDSYYGLTKQVPVLKEIYDVLFLFSSYTRNGLFYAPVFLVTGAWIYRKEHTGKGKNIFAGEVKSLNYTGSGKMVVNAAAFIVSAGLMIFEGMALHRLDLQRHDSMYLMLPPVMFFLFRILVSVKCAPLKCLRAVSTWIYLIHPFCIILVRGAAKAVHQEHLFVENSLTHYLAVCVLSFTGACMMAAVQSKVQRKIPAGIPVFGQKEQRFDKGRAWIELNRENLARNVETFKGLLVSGQKLMPALKADAYGHGAVLMAAELQKMGIDAFCVACAEEGAELRENGITGEILVLGYTHPEKFPLLRKYRLIQTVVDHAYAKVLNSYGRKIKVYVKIDTGMHRLGERPEKEEEISGIFRLKNLQVEGVYTHLCADETKKPQEREFTKKQVELFYEMVSRLEKQGYSNLKTHLLASYGLINYPESGGDYVRPGIALYGLLSDGEAGENCPVRLYPVLSLKARIAAVKDLYRGESAGYGLAYRAEEDRKIAVLAIGYADGLPRCLSDGAGRVLIHGQSAPVIGRICMDQTIVDITGISGVEAGETAVVIGRSQGEEITAYEIAEKAGTITNEVLSRMGKRLSRVMD